MKHRQKTDQMEERTPDEPKPKHRRNMLLERIRQNKAHEKGRRQTILNMCIYSRTRWSPQLSVCGDDPSYHIDTHCNGDEKKHCEKYDEYLCMEEMRGECLWG